ncbi:MAG: lamin tail domain-containing protein [Nitrosopumilus sp.]
MNQSLSIVFSIFLLVGIIIPAYAQTSDNVVINEVDINPFGDDSASISEWVELYNPTDSDIDLGGWEIASTTVLKKTMTIPSGTVIEPGQFIKYQYVKVWFTDSAESVELRDENGIVIDKTPILTDIQNDFTSWQRLYDGYDSDSSNDWKFATSTAGSSNGKLIEPQESQGITVTASSEKSSYLFGEIAVIRGSVSEEVETVKPYFLPEPILVRIIGPNYDKTVTLYPDLNLNYETTLSLHQVLGIYEGTYDVFVTYAGATADTSFSVGFELIEQEEKVDGALNIITDKSQYLPGQTVSISGFAEDIVPFEGMKFTVIDSRGEEIANGNLFPTDGEFTTTVFITSITPGYGTYEINAEYSGKSVSTTFEVVEDIKEDVPISLWTDKEAYGLGDEVKISGRLNHVWINNLDLEITQTKQSTLGSSSSGSDAGFKILDSVKIMGDGSFSYAFTIPDNSLRLGDYRINVSKDIGSAYVIAHAVSDPENFVVSSEPLTIESDKGLYDLGETMTISGFVKDPYENSSYSTGTAVTITISHEDGSPLEILALPSGSKTRINDGIIVGYDFTAIPETSGRYSIQVDVTQNIFTEGNYVVKAQYSDDIATNTFTIIDPLDLKDGAVILLDKDVYGLDETVYLTGVLPPTGDNSIEISVTRPDGTRTDYGSTVDNQRFSWSWTTPITEKYQNIKTGDGRDVIKSNFGVYKIRIATDTYSENRFFKVSADPENDSLSTTPLFVSTEKSLYKAGEKLKVIGNVILREQGDEGLVVPERVQITVLDGTFPYNQIHESSVYPNQGGEFSSLFELPITLFNEGPYIVKANYANTRDEVTFSVANDFVFGIDEPVSLLASTDKSEYYPGDTVVINGKPNKLIYLEEFDVSIIQKADTEITCGSFICGTNSGPTTSIRPSPSGSFTHEFTIPDLVSAIGVYEVTIDADFETKSIQFDVIEKPQTIISDTVIEKENRIPEKTIPISTEEKTTDDVTIAPRVLSGSLITPSRGDEPSVNLKVSTETGICIIGSDADCLVSDSTRKQGQIYDVVEVDGISLNVRYSGPDVRLEKFSILPESSTEFLPDADWNVEVIKDDQVSRFYYKVTYKTLE